MPRRAKAIPPRRISRAIGGEPFSPPGNVPGSREGRARGEHGPSASLGPPSRKDPRPQSASRVRSLVF
jgi:hypothetical protein